MSKNHSAVVHTRYFSGGFEFETAKHARAWVSEQHGRETAETIRMTAFDSLVCSNGVAAKFYHSQFEMNVQTTTYQTEGTMRDRSRVSSPSDCVWLIPDANAAENAIHEADYLWRFPRKR